MDVSPLIPPRPQKDWVYFLDFDGTLVDIAERPEGVRVKRELVDLLAAVNRATAEAVVLISGRSIADLDCHLRPLQLPAAGLHGFEYRLEPGGAVRTESRDNSLLDPARRRLGAFATSHTGVQLEDKGASLALHFRRAPQVATEARLITENACRDLGPTFTCLAGKMVYEIKPRDTHKGQAIARFLQREELRDRRPVFLGDDVTDEDGFRACNRRGGLSIRVGDLRTPTEASFRLEDVNGVEAWLGQLIEVKSRSHS